MGGANMNPHLIAAIITLVILSIFLIIKRKNLEVQGKFPFAYILKYNSTIGINLAERIAKRFKNLTLKLHTPLLIFCALCMFAMLGLTGWAVYKAVLAALTPGSLSAQVIGIVSPIPLKNQIYIPFIYWLASISVIMTIHEFAHALLCAANGIKIKNTGIAVLGLIIPLIPAAFVEPDEESLKQASKFARTTMFSAGSIANILSSIFFFIIALGLAFYSADQPSGYTATILPGSAMEGSGMTNGEVITEINGNQITSETAFRDAIRGETQLKVTTNKGNYQILYNGNNIGLHLTAHNGPKQWLYTLFNWLFILSLGIGLTNLLPVKPLDGGLILEETLGKFTTKAKTITAVVSLVIIAALITTMII